jgi:hypothetical protein
LYLTHAEKKILARNVCKLLGTFNGGQWILSDAYTRKSWQEIASMDESRTQLANLSKISERDIEKNCFEDEDDLSEFFAEADFRVKERHRYSGIFDDLSSLKLLNQKEAGLLKQKLDLMDSFALIFQKL